METTTIKNKLNEAKEDKTELRDKAASSSPSLPFLTCHVTLLQSLYFSKNENHFSKSNSNPSINKNNYASDISNDNNNDVNSSSIPLESPVPDEIWKLISLYLSKRKRIESIQNQTTNHSGIYDEATFTSITSLFFSNPSPPMSSPFYNYGHHHHHHHHHHHNPYMTNTTTTITSMPTHYFPRSHGKKRKAHWLHPSPSSYSPFLSPQQRPPKQQRRQDKNVPSAVTSTSSSWTFITKLLEKRKKTSLIKSNQTCQPFLPLLEKVDKKIKELYHILHLLSKTQQKKRREQILRLISVEEDETETEKSHNRDGLELGSDGIGKNVKDDNKFGMLDHYCQDQDYIAKISMKVNLWERLANSLKLIMMHKT